MTRQVGVWMLIAMATSWIVAPRAVRGDGFVDFGIGAAHTDSDVSPTFNGGPEVSAKSDSFTAVIRGGYWFEGIPWLGVGGSVSFFQPDFEADVGLGSPVRTPLD